MADLTQIRERIDAVDDQILDLFAQRMALTDEVAAYTAERGLPGLDRARERAKLAAVSEAAPEGVRDYAAVLFNLLMEVSRANQSAYVSGSPDLAEAIEQARRKTPDLFPRSAFVACQGVEGAFSQLAADKLFKHADLSFFSTFEGVFKAVDQGFCQYGVLPFENSTAGTVNQVYDLMGAYDFHIVRTVRLKVDHNLLAKPGCTLADVTDIYSHQQAVDQCADFLASLEGVTVHMVENTAVAAKMVADTDNPGAAALGSRNAAEVYGLDIVRRAVQDMGNNYTRFACISKDLEIYPGANRTSLSAVVANRPGSLYKVLARFYSLDINLVKLESRPLADRDFDYLFYFDVDCPVAAPEFMRLIGSLDDVCEEFRYLGSYSEEV